MSYSGLLTQEVVLHLQGAEAGEDEHGNPVPGPEVSLRTRGYAGRQARTEQGSESVQSEALTLFLEAGAPLTGWDAVTVEGVRFEVVGPPWCVWNPRTGTAHHVEASIRRTA